MKRWFIMLAMILCLGVNIIDASIGPLYAEDFNSGKRLADLGFMGIGWFLDTQKDCMTTDIHGHARNARIDSKAFKADRTLGCVSAEWDIQYTSFAKRERPENDRTIVSLIDSRGCAQYSLIIEVHPHHGPHAPHARMERYEMTLVREGFHGRRILGHGMTERKTTSECAIHFRWVLDSIQNGISDGTIRVYANFGDGEILLLSVKDKTYQAFSRLRFIHEPRSHSRMQASIDNILVTGEAGSSSDTTPPTTTHDDKTNGAWVNHPVQIHLNAIDAGSGVAQTYFQVDNGQVQNGNVLNLNEDGNHTVTYWSVDQTGNPETKKSLTIKIDQSGPVLLSAMQPQPNALGWVNQDVTVTFAATDPNSGVESVTSPINIATEGAGQSIQGEAKDKVGNVSTTNVIMNMDKTPPSVVSIYPKNGEFVNQVRPTITAELADNLSGIDSVFLKVDGKVVNASVSGSQLSYLPSADFEEGRHTFVVKVSDKAGNVSSEVSATFTIDSTLPTLPRDPAEVATKLDTTAFTSMFDATKFLYTGENSIQTGVADGTIEPKRAAVLRGKVLNKDGQPLPGVKVTVLNHSEYGQTYTRADGMFDLAVNGGGYLTVKYERTDYLSAQRQVDVPWQDYAWLPEICLIRADNQVTEIELGSSTEVQVAQGSTVIDKDGTRQATIIFPEGIQVKGYSGTSLHIRATEYTVGENGPKMMPAELPPTTGYTYCVDLSADEAQHIQFNKPVYFYVDNFLKMPVGIQVPVGYYDEARGVWVPSEDGRVIQILAINNEMADVDVDGGGLAADAEKLAQYGFNDQERQKLANLYSVGQTLWRAPMKHFSIYDCNFGATPEKGAENPKNKKPSNAKDDNSDTECGSIIEIQNQVLGETVGITGTPFMLHYAGDRVPGRIFDNTFVIPLTGETIPSVLKRVDLKISVGGKTVTKSFSPKPKQNYTFIWDGKDTYGRDVQGGLIVTIQIGYVYNGYYNLPPRIAQSFESASGEPIPGDIFAREDAILWQEMKVVLYNHRAKELGLGGWGINVQHYYDPVTRVLYYGNGQRRSVESIDAVINTFAGNGLWDNSGDGGQANLAQVNHPEKVNISPEGDVYISNYKMIRRVAQDGIISTIAGGNESGYGGDGGLAIDAKFDCIRDMDFGPDGYLYVVDGVNNRIRRIGKDGVVTTIVGTGEKGYTGDGGLAINAKIDNPWGIAVAKDGSVYFSDTNNHCIRVIRPNGLIYTVVGTGEEREGPETIGLNGPATKARLYSPTSLDIDNYGNLYFIDSQVFKVTPDGVITHFADSFNDGSVDDGVLSTEAAINHAVDLEVDGNYVYIVDCYYERILRVDPDGRIFSVAGTWNKSGFEGDSGPALNGTFNWPSGIAIGKDGCIYIADYLNNRIRRIYRELPGFTKEEIAIPSEDGSELYKFDVNGRHLATVSTLTHKAVCTFQYDDHGYLRQVTDIDGNITTIERSSTGAPIAIIAPNGQRTELTLNGQGYLSTITNPAGETTRLTYRDGGLLETFTEPKGNIHRFYYDDLGRLTKDEDPAGGYTALERSETDDGFIVKKRNNVDGKSEKITTYTTKHLPTEDMLRIVDGCCSGGHTETLQRKDGSEKTTYADGTIVETFYGPDPRFGMQAPIIKKQTITTPQGLVYTRIGERSVQLSNPDDPFSIQSLTDTISVNGKTSTSVYDVATHTVTSTSPMGRQTVTTLDEKGRVVKVEVPGLVPVTFEYDSRGRLFKTTQGSGSDARISSIVYNADGWVESVTDPMLHITSFNYDAVGRVKKQTLPDNRVIQFNYDSNGNMTTLTPPGKPEHGFSYNAVNLTDKYTPPTVTNGGETSYEYNLAKQPTLVTRPDGKTIGFEYDTMGRLVTLTLPDGEIAYTYDATTGQLKNVISRDGGALTYGYDGELPTSVTWGGTIKGKVGVTYNNDFAVETQSVNDGQTVSYAYDNDGLLTQAGDLTATYDLQNGAITGTKIGNVTDSYGYTPFGEVKDYAASVSGVGVYSSSFTYDKLGRISTKTETVNGETHTYQYGYDSIGQLTDVWVDGSLKSHYDYDGNGNRVGGTYDDQDRMIKYGENTYQYSANGELQQKVTPTGTTKYEYDTLGNLTAVMLEDGAKIEYVIDGANRRVGKKVNGVLVQGWLYQDGLKPVAELDGNGNVVTQFVYGTSGIVPDYMIKNGVEYRIICNNLGCPRLVVDSVTGQVVQRMEYDEFGNLTLDTNPGFQPFGFVGGLYDRDTKLTRFGARDYDAESGRWTAKDPIGFSGGINLYSYIMNDPINNIDIDGLTGKPNQKSCIQMALERLAQTNWAKTKKGNLELGLLNQMYKDGKISFTDGNYVGEYKEGKISINSEYCKNKDYQQWLPGILAHEGSHALHHKNNPRDLYDFEDERYAYNSESDVDWEVTGINSEMSDFEIKENYKWRFLLAKLQRTWGIR